MQQYSVTLTEAAKLDLQRFYRFLASKDEKSAKEARMAIREGINLLKIFPFACRKVDSDNPFLRELTIPFGHSGYVALYEIINDKMVMILAFRHQLEEDYFY